MLNEVRLIGTVERIVKEETNESSKTIIALEVVGKEKTRCFKVGFVENETDLKCGDFILVKAKLTYNNDELVIKGKSYVKLASVPPIEENEEDCE